MATDFLKNVYVFILYGTNNILNRQFSVYVKILCFYFVPNILGQIQPIFTQKIKLNDSSISMTSHTSTREWQFK